MKGCFVTACVVIIIILGIIWGYNCYAVNRDVVGYMHRAQVAAQSEDALAYIQTTIKALEYGSMDRGNTAFIFGTPKSDMGLVMNSLHGLEERLTQLNAMDKASVEYQSGMDDVRGIIRELTEGDENGGAQISASDLVWRFRGGFLFMNIIIFLVVIGVALLAEDY